MVIFVSFLQGYTGWMLISRWLQKSRMFTSWWGTSGEYITLYSLSTLCFVADLASLIYVCMCCMCVYEGTVPCMWVWRLEVYLCRVSSSVSLHLIDQSLIDLSRLPEWPAQGSIYPVLGTFTWVLEIQIQVLMLAW